MKRSEYFLDYQKLEEITGDYLFFDEKDKAYFKYEFLKQIYFNKPSKKYDCPVMLYLGNKKFNTKYELEDIFQQIKSGATRTETDYYRSNFKEFDTSILCKQFLNTFKSFTPCGIFYNRKSRVEIRQLNGIIMLQNFYEELSSEQLNQIKNDKFTFAVIRLLQPNRYAVLVKTNGMTSKNYKQFQKYVQDYYNDLLEDRILNQMQINTIVYLAFDQHIYINQNCNYLSKRDKKEILV